MVNIVIHCSDSKWGNAAEIAKWHVLPKPKGNGWDAIGYHYVILNGWLSSKKYHHKHDGRLETGRALDDDKDIERDEWGAHVVGHNNSVGICLIGESGKFTTAQRIRLFDLLMQLKEQFKYIEIMQHSDLDPINKPWCAGLSQNIIDYFNAEL